MANEKSRTRGSFSSSIGFILSAAGSAIGLGNLWKFPYIAGSTGGGVFLLFYIIFTIVLGIPIILAEIAIGRKTQLSSVAAYEKLHKGYGFIGAIGVICGFILLSYYSVVGGWIIKYIIIYGSDGNLGRDKSGYFNNFVASSVEPVTWHLIFMIVCAIIVLCGIHNGIEKASGIMMPALFVMIIILAIRAVMLDGAVEGLKFLFIPNKTSFNSLSDLANSIVQAMGQVFFSLSLGIGITITYGSYLKKESNIQKDTVIIAVLDTIMAVLAGILVMSAVFSFGIEPSSGPGLIFGALPTVFDAMPFGAVIGFIFFVLVFFAAITSAMALLEAIVSYLVDSRGWSRAKSTVWTAATIVIAGTFVALSMSDLSDEVLFGINLFDVFGFFTDKVLMPLSALLMCIFVGHIIGVDGIADEIEIGSKGFRLRGAFEVIIKYVAPVFIVFIFVMGFIK